MRLNGRVYEGVAARLRRRPACDLYHAALEVRVPEGRFVIEMTPIPFRDVGERGVVVEGAVGSRWASRFRIFRYEVRCWRDGVIPDLGEAVESPRQLTGDPSHAWRVLDLVPAVPPLVWGRDESRAGDMWNSNSLIAWLLARSGLYGSGGAAARREDVLRVGTPGSWWRSGSRRPPSEPVWRNHGRIGGLTDGCAMVVVGPGGGLR